MKLTRRKRVEATFYFTSAVIFFAPCQVFQEFFFHFVPDGPSISIADLCNRPYGFFTALSKLWLRFMDVGQVLEAFFLIQLFLGPCVVAQGNRVIVGTHVTIEWVLDMKNKWRWRRFWEIGLKS
jgi:hypothetical protein